MNPSVAHLMTNWRDVEYFTPTQRTDSYPFITPSNSDMKGKSVFITGASKGIGRGTAMSSTKAGCSKIAVAARSDLSAVEDEIKATARNCNLPIPQILCLQLDVTSEESVTSAAEKLEAAFGSLDVLFNNAGVMEAIVPLTESDPVDVCTFRIILFSCSHVLRVSITLLYVSGALGHSKGILKLAKRLIIS
jgi:NAD(P)-dependent dehydrogenase (short-subunit alcohol dehydrogenase family)